MLSGEVKVSGDAVTKIIKESPSFEIVCTCVKIAACSLGSAGGSSSTRVRGLLMQCSRTLASNDFCKSYTDRLLL